MMHTVGRPMASQGRLQRQATARLSAPRPLRVAPVTLLAPPRFVSGVQRRGVLQARCAFGLAKPGEEANQQDDGFSPRMQVPEVFAAKGGGGTSGMGSNSSFSAVMERSKIEIVMPTPPTSGPKLDDTGNGGDNGKNLHNGGGGGDGGGGDGDDDDYFGNGDGDGEGGDGDGSGGGFWRTPLPLLYDRVTIQAVLSEWMKTIADLPVIFRQAVERGLVSSTMLVRWMVMDVRPNVTRAAYRTLPLSLQRELVGRLMADPAFVQKLVMEQIFAIGSSLVYEMRVRGDRFRHELDQVAINTLGVAAATGAAFWSVAPSRTYSSISKMDWQIMAEKLPNCVFDASTQIKAFDMQQRIASLLMRSASLSAIGVVTGALTSAAANASTALRQRFDPSYAPSVPAPPISASVGLGAFFGAFAHGRLQAMGGIDRFLMDRTNSFWAYVAMSAVGRGASAAALDSVRPSWQGLPVAPKLVLSSRASRSKKAATKRQPRRPAGTKSQPTLTQQQPAAPVAAPDAMEGALAAAAVAGATLPASDASAAAALSGAAAPLQETSTSVPADAVAAAPEQPLAASTSYAPSSPLDAAPAAAGGPVSEVEQTLRSQLAELSAQQTLQQLDAAAVATLEAANAPAGAPSSQVLTPS